MRLEARPVRIPFRAPLRAAHDLGGGAAPDPDGERTLVLVTLTDSCGAVGHGEAAPLDSYDGVSVAAVLAAIDRYRDALAGGTGDAHDAGAALTAGAAPAASPVAVIADILAACARLDPLPQALAAIDLALWDLAGRRAGEPVWRLLGAADAPPVTLNATIGAEPPPAAARHAERAVADDFGTLKVKVGDGDDLARVAAVRDAVGPDVAIRLDANGAWDEDGAVRALAALAPLGIELCEEPVHGVGALGAVARRVPGVPVFADESAGAVLAASRPSGSRELGAPASGPATRDGSVAGVCLKIAASGGISGLIRDAARARAAGLGVYVASTLDGPLGIAAALHAAAVVRPERPCGLATLDRFAAVDPLPVRGGTVDAPAGPGLGRGLIDWYPAAVPLRKSGQLF